MKRQIALFFMVVLLIGLLLPSASIGRGTDHSEEKLSDFSVVTIETDPAIPPHGDEDPEADENVLVTVESLTVIDEAYLNVSARRWDGEPVRGLEPSDPGRWALDISEDGHSASQILNNVKYFPPGTEVTWNIHLINYEQPYSTYTSRNFTYEVKGAWNYNNTYEDAFDRNLHLDISPELPPNAWDPVTLTLRSRYDDVEIGRALVEIEFGNETTGDIGAKEFRNVDPVEGIEEVKIDGYPAGTEVEFYVRAWDDPDDASREIQSEVYEYTVHDGNTWQHPDFEDNIDLTTDPDVTGEDSSVAIGQGVNITIESEPDVPIEAAAFEYEIGGRGVETQEGQDVFTEISSTEWYYEMAGQPPGIEISFKVRAYDIMRRDIVSETYHYVVEEEEVEAPEEMTFFYVTVFDGERNEYVGGADVIIQNETWIWEGQTNPSGFAYPTEMNTLEPTYLHYGTYDITVEYQGMTENETYELSPQSDDTIEFVFNPTEDMEDVDYASPVDNPPYYLIGLTITGGLAGVMGYFLYTLRKGRDEETGLARGG